MEQGPGFDVGDKSSIINNNGTSGDVYTGVWMVNVRKRVQKDAARQHAAMRSMPGFKVQTKVSSILQRKFVDREGGATGGKGGTSVGGKNGANGSSSSGGGGGKLELKRSSPALASVKEVQMGVQAALARGDHYQRRSLGKLHNLGESTSHDGTRKQQEEEEENRNDGTNSNSNNKKNARQMPTTVHRLSQKVFKRMNELNMDEVTQSVVGEYLTSNPDKSLRYAQEVRRENMEVRRMRRATRVKRSHEHVFPQNLSVIRTADKDSQFPRGVLRDSLLDLSKTKSGNTPVRLQVQEGEDRLDQTFGLPSIGSRGDASMPYTTLGARLPILKIAHDQIEFDMSTIASLTSNNNSLIKRIVSEQDVMFGPVVFSRSEDTAEKEEGRTATPPPPLLPKIDCGKFRTVVGSSSSASVSHPPALSPVALSSSPSPLMGMSVLASSQQTPTAMTTITEQPSINIKSHLSYPVLTPEEMALLDVEDAGNEELGDHHSGGAAGGIVGGGGDHHRGEQLAVKANSGGSDVLQIQQLAQHAGPAVPTGIFAKLIREVDSCDAQSTDSEYEPFCLICRSKRVPDVISDDLQSVVSRSHSSAEVDHHHRQPPSNDAITTSSLSRMNDKKYQVGSSSSYVSIANHAKESLHHWKAMHQHALIDASSSLQRRLERRDVAYHHVTRSVSSLGVLSKQAKKVASSWANSRGLQPPRARVESVWISPGRHLKRKHAQWENCRHLWNRIEHYTNLIRFPMTEEQVLFLEHLRALLLQLECVSKSLFFRWLHMCGNRAISARENARFSMFLRETLNISATALHRWCKLPEQRKQGWKLSGDV